MFVSTITPTPLTFLEIQSCPTDSFKLQFSLVKLFLPAIILVLVVLGTFYFARQLNVKQNPTQSSPPGQSQSTNSAGTVSTQVATIELEKGGLIKIRLDTTNTPKASANFAQKANAGSYDNLIFHRVEPGFVIQGGDPLGNGQGGQNNLPAEYQNVMFKTGSVGMASLSGRANFVNDAQFFITTSDNKLSAQDYVMFGQVTAGMDVMTGIRIGDKIRRIRVQTSQI